MTEECTGLVHDKSALGIIFLKHFYSYNGLSVAQVARLVATEYLEYLQIKCGAYVPEQYRNTVLLDLMEDVKEMVTSKIADCPTISDYHDKHDSEIKEMREECDKKYLDLF